MIPLRFVLNALPLRKGGGLTIGLEIVRCLPSVTSEHHFHVLASPGVGYEELVARNVTVETIKWAELGEWGQLRFLNTQLPRICERENSDVLFSMGNMASITVKRPQLVLFHLAHMIYPEIVRTMSSGWRQKIHYVVRRRYFAAGIRRSFVAAQTSVAKERLVRQFRIPPERIIVVPNAFSQESYERRPGPRSAALSRLTKRYRLLYLTSYYPHKNLEILVKVALRLRELKQTDFVFVTTLSPDDPDARRFLEYANRTAPDYFFNVGHVPLSEIRSCLEESWALVMPTLLESFSGTYLEAMNAGCPILTSDRDFARAICGDAAIYFDPLDPDDIVKAIFRLRDSDDAREKLVRAGRANLARVTPGWNEVTRTYVQVLERIAIARPK